jgi:integrase
MARSNSTSPSPARPAKPYEDFPLFPHATKRWAKKIRGKMHYFGPWDNPQAALDLYLAQKDALHAGRKPREDGDQGKTVKDLANAFWNAKNALLRSEEISPRTFADVGRITDLIVAQFGKSRLLSDLGPDDFSDLRNSMAKRLGPVTLRNEIQRVRSVFKFAFDAGLVEAPVRFGPGFKRPSLKTVRLNKNKTGKKLFEAAEIRQMLDKAEQPLKAMILLGLNCAFGNADCGTLPRVALDLEKGWIDYPRPKTGVERRCPLWPETIEAIRAAMSARPAAKDEQDAELVFITKYGGPWHKDIPDSPITKETRKLLDTLKVNGRRNFYCLRHTFQTIGDEAKDFLAVRHIMGHADSDISANYRERISDERLRAVADHVRAWLFGVLAQ